MALVEIKMPEMGESVMEATVISWLKKVGDEVVAEEPLLEVATDKVDTEVPAIYGGVLREILVKDGEVVRIGAPIAVFDMEGVAVEETITHKKVSNNVMISEKQNGKPELDKTETSPDIPQEPAAASTALSENIKPEMKPEPVEANARPSGRFYSPLVRNIAAQENIPMKQLEEIEGSGMDGRVTKGDVLDFIKAQKSDPPPSPPNNDFPDHSEPEIHKPIVGQTNENGDEVIKMDRVRKIIADNMVASQRISAHVHSFVEADVTGIVSWKKKVQDYFLNEKGVKLTYSPIFVEAIVKALKEFPLMNSSVEGDNIIMKKRINIGIAVALPNGNLIVPVIKDADQLNLIGLARQMSDLAKRARERKLSPDEVAGSTYTMTNVGSFGSTMGTPIIQQPNVAILAIGSIEKKPSVIETEEYGDILAIRHKLFLSHSYDHRVIDGALGGLFVKRVAECLEHFDMTREY